MRNKCDTVSELTGQFLTLYIFIFNNLTEIKFLKLNKG